MTGVQKTAIFTLRSGSTESLLDEEVETEDESNNRVDDLEHASHRHGHGHGSGHRRYERDGVCGCGERTTYGRRLRCCLCQDKRNDENRADATEGSLLSSSIQATSKASTATSSTVSSSSSLSSPLPAHVHSGVLPCGCNAAAAAGERRRRGCGQARDGIKSSSPSMTEDNIALVASGSGSGSVLSTSTSSSTAPASNFYSAAESSPSSSSSSTSTSSSTLARTAANSSSLSPSPPPPPSRSGGVQQSELSLSRSRAYRKRVARQYYALCELVETERTYVGNLRVLVDVYLAALSLSSSSSSTAHSSIYGTGTNGQTRRTRTRTRTVSGPRREYSGIHGRCRTCLASGGGYDATMVYHHHHHHALQVHGLPHPPSSYGLNSVNGPCTSGRSKGVPGSSLGGTGSVGGGAGGSNPATCCCTCGVQVRSCECEESGSGTGLAISSIGEDDPSLIKMKERNHIRRRTTHCTVQEATAASSVAVATVNSEKEAFEKRKRHVSTPLQTVCGVPLGMNVVLSQNNGGAGDLQSQSHQHQHQQQPNPHSIAHILTQAEKESIELGVSDILSIHERLVETLERVLEEAGFVFGMDAGVVLGVGGGGGAELLEGVDVYRSEWDGWMSACAKVEGALRAVCEVYVKEAQNFTPYCHFCAGHTKALDIVRKVSRMHQNEWSEWEKRCAELAADTERDDDQDVFVTDEPEEVHDDTITEMNNYGDVLSLTQQDIEDAKLTRRHSASSVLFSGFGFGRYGHHQQSQRNSVLHVSTATSLGGSSGPSSSASASSRGRTESGSSSAVSSSSTTQSSVPSFSRSQSSTLLGTGLKHTKSDPPPRSASAVSIALSKRLSRSVPHSPTATTIPLPTDEYGNTVSVASRTGSGVMETGNTAGAQGLSKSFTDYLIMPVQRLCKYPILFGQLLSGRPIEGACESEWERSEEATNEVVRRALASVKAVATDVDKASMKRVLEDKSRLVVDRIVAGNPPESEVVDIDFDGDDTSACAKSADGHDADDFAERRLSRTNPLARTFSISHTFGAGRSSRRASRVWSKYVPTTVDGPANKLVPGPPSRPFLISLGACLFAGALDVIVFEQLPVPAPVSSQESERRARLRKAPPRSPSSPRSRSGSVSPGRSPRRRSPQTRSRPRTAPSQSPPPPLARAPSIGLTASTSMGGISSYSFAPRESVSAKYLGAFLYVGGYMVLVKAVKAGVYVARHWFSLCSEAIEVVDVSEDDALLPCSFHIVFKASGHRLELAAACKREKEMWLAAINNALMVNCQDQWVNEPVQHLTAARARPLGRRGRDRDFEGFSTVPTSKTAPSTLGDSCDEQGLPHKDSMATIRQEVPATVRASKTLSRRTSRTGMVVRSLFPSNSTSNSPLSASPSSSSLSHGFVSFPPVRRPSTSRRMQIDGWLADVMSEPCLSARTNARKQDEVLFREPSSRSGNTPGHSPAGTKAPNKRKSFAMRLPLSGFFSDSTDENNGVVNGFGQYDKSDQSPVSPDSPLPPLSLSACSFTTGHGHMLSPLTEQYQAEPEIKVRIAGSDSSSPQLGVQELPGILEPDGRPKRTRSFVDNVRDFFIPRSLSPSPSPSRCSAYSSQTSSKDSQNGEDKTSEHVLTRLWRHASLRQRVRSAPDVPATKPPTQLDPEQHPPSSYILSRPSDILGAHMRHSSDGGEMTVKREAMSQRESSSTAPDPVNIQRRRSLFSSGRTHFPISKRTSKTRLIPSTLKPLTPLVVEKAS